MDTFHALADKLQGEAPVMRIMSKMFSSLPEEVRESALAKIRDALPAWVAQFSNALRITVTEVEAREILDYIERPKPPALVKVENLSNIMEPLFSAHMKSVLEKP